MTNVEVCIKAAEGWEAGADEAESMAAWERATGLDMSAPGQSPGDHRARSARNCAQTLRLEALTGLPHCMCHLRPEKDCPWSGQGVRL